MFSSLAPAALVAPLAATDERLLPRATCAVSPLLDADGSGAASAAHAATRPTAAFLTVNRFMLCDCRDRARVER
jgi:hypothetical protein